MNLLTETIEAINEMGKTSYDVAWVGSLEFGWFLWDDFAAVADIEYDAGYGGQEVASDLVVMFSDGEYMTRGEYDGSEWWEQHPQLIKPAIYRKPKRVVNGMWASLTEQNESEDDN